MLEGNTKGAILVVTYERWHTTTYIGVMLNNTTKMNRSFFSVLTLMAFLSSRNITLFVISFLSWVMIQSHLLPQVDLDVLIYDRFLLR